MESCARDHRPLLPTGEETSRAASGWWHGLEGVFASHPSRALCRYPWGPVPSKATRLFWAGASWCTLLPVHQRMEGNRQSPQEEIIIGKPRAHGMVPGTQSGLDSYLQRINESSRCGCIPALSTPQVLGHVLLWLFMGKRSCGGRVLLALGSGRVGWYAVGRHVDSPGGRNEAVGWVFHLLEKTAALSILGNKLSGFVAFLPSSRTHSVPT